MTLHLLSPLDGRYQKDTAPLRNYFSEFAYLRTRARLELDFLSALSRIGICPPINISLDVFTNEDALKIQEYEKTTRHDVKEIEYFLRDKIEAHNSEQSEESPANQEETLRQRKAQSDIVPWIHFGVTSDDINSIAENLALRDSRDRVYLPALDDLIASQRDFAKTYRALPMLARTHGQPVVPTTLGKEIAVYLARLKTCRNEIADHKFEAKLTGAVGNFNALQSAAPQVNWISFSKEFIESFDLQPNLVTTQILPYENWIRYFDPIKLANLDRKSVV